MYTLQCMPCGTFVHPLYHVRTPKPPLMLAFPPLPLSPACVACPPKAGYKTYADTNWEGAEGSYGDQVTAEEAEELCNNDPECIVSLTVASSIIQDLHCT